MMRRKMKWTRLILLAGVAAIAGCSTPRPGTQSPQIRQAARCGDEPSALSARLLGPASIEQVEPLYGIVYSTPNGQESRLLGAKLHLRPIEGTTAEAVTHALYCHAAAEALRGDDASPFWIPGGWLDISVKYEADGYVVTLEGRDFNEANAILTRARAYAQR